MDGQVFPVNKMQAGSTAPLFHPWCRCTTAPYYEDMAGVGQRFARDKDGKTYTVPSDMTYAEWKKVSLEKGGTTEEYEALKAKGALTNIPKSSKLKINIQHFGINPKDFETLILPKKEYAHVMAEINTNITKEQLNKKVVSKYIGDYVYTFECFGYNNYRIFYKEKIEGID